MPNITKRAQGTLTQRYSDFWLSKVQQERKMRTFVTFKDKFVMEDYLMISDFHLRRCLTKLRISAHIQSCNINRENGIV